MCVYTYFWIVGSPKMIVIIEAWVLCEKDLTMFCQISFLFLVWLGLGIGLELGLG